MTVIILHPTEELKLIKLQKELINSLYSDSRIITAAYPLWIKLDEFDLQDKASIKKIEFGEFEVDRNTVGLPVFIDCDKGIINSKLTLVSIYKGNDFSDMDNIFVSQIKKPVKQLKVFRLALVQEESPHATSISKSVWCKLHHTATTVE